MKPLTGGTLNLNKPDMLVSDAISSIFESLFFSRASSYIDDNISRAILSQFKNKISTEITTL